MSDTDFSKARAGDRVCDIAFPCEPGGTNGKIARCWDNTEIEILLDCGLSRSYSTKGKYMQTRAQTLFWSKPDFVIPGRPKKKVWLRYCPKVTINKDGTKWHSSTCLYYEKEKTEFIEGYNLIEIEIEVEDCYEE